MLNQLEEMNRFIKAIKPTNPEFYTKQDVVYETDLFKLHMFRFDPSAPATMIITPDAGHGPIIADMGPNKSIVETTMKSKAGSVFLLGWKGATQQTKNTSFEDIITSIDEARWAASGPNKTHMIGLCAGGWKATLYTAMFPDNVSRLTINGAPIDFCIGGGNIQKIVQKTPQSVYEMVVRMNRGIMPGELMLASWKWMHPIDRYFIDFQKLWNAVSDEVAYAKMIRDRAWYENTYDIPGVWYLRAVDDLFRKNKLVNKQLYVNGSIVDLANIYCPVDVINGDDDDITLIKQCFALADHISTPEHLITRTIMKGLGHVGGFCSGKAQHTLGEVIGRKIG